MEKGKIITIFAGVITLLANYVLIWYIQTVSYADYNTSGLGGLINFPDVFLHGQKYADYLGWPLWMIYVGSLLIILPLIAGVLQILVVKKPKLAIIGSIIPLVLGIMILVGLSLIPNLLKYLEIFGSRSAIILGILPINLEIPGRPESLGTYALIAGGIIGIVGLYLAREDLY